MNQLWKILVLAAAVSGFTTHVLSAQNTMDTMKTVGSDIKEDMYFAVGVSAGLLSGAGLAARLSLPGGSAFQLAFLPVSVPGEKYTTHFNIGVEGQYSFVQSNSGRLYGLVGMGYYGTWSDRPDLTGNVIESPFRMGIGVGNEFFVSPNFVFALSGAIAYFPRTSEFFPLPEIGLFYYFK